MVTRWGIVCIGGMASDFATAMKTLKEEHRLVAVCAIRASRLPHVQKFAAEHGDPKAYGSCEELSADPEVEAVYIATYLSYHLTAARIMIEAGKHVLCEMPLCINVQQTKELIDLARKKQVFLMEAFWSRFFPVYKVMMRTIENGEIGKVQQVICSMGKCGRRKVCPLRGVVGPCCILDFGIYCVQFISLVMGGEKPIQVAAVGHRNKIGGASTTNSSIVYSEGRLATISTSTVCDLPCEAFVIGTKGTIKIPFPFWCPVTIETPSGHFEAPLPYFGEDFNFMNGQGMMFGATEVRKCLKKGLLESPTITLDETVTIAEIVEAMKKQVGLDHK